MSRQPFAGTRKTEKLINRQNELEQIYNAIYHTKTGCHVVFVYGPGGMGKSRLVEEVLWRGGNNQMQALHARAPEGEENWVGHKTINGCTAVYGDLIDLSDPQYNSRNYLMEAIRNALVGEGQVSFNDYDRARSNYLGLLQVGADSRRIDAAAKEAENSFIKDIKENEANNRLVLVFDTAEKLHFGASKELLEKGILDAAELSFNSAQWLVELIQGKQIANTTLLLVGRDEEGKEFSDTIRTAWGTEYQPDEIQMTPFKPEDVKAYFQQLVEDWKSISSQDPEWRNFPDQLSWIAEDDGECRVLWLYTGGQPVRLALYIDVLLQGYTMPKPLKDTWEEAVDRVGTDDPIHNPTKALEDAQLEIEKEFISFIFLQTGLETQILKNLVRTPRGLTIEQLIYLQYSPPDIDLNNWTPDNEHRRKITDALDWMQMLSIAKRRPHERLGLQDEVYHIYARHMSKDPGNKADETVERRKLYSKLYRWAQFQVEEYRSQKQVFQESDERSLQFSSPVQALKIEFPDPGKIERDRRSTIHNEIRSWLLEEVHYYLLVDLVENLNVVLFRLTDRSYISAHENEDLLILTEVNQVLGNPDLLEFIKVKSWDAIEAIGEIPDIALRRVMRQQEYTQWLRRFVLRIRYDSALRYYEKLEAYIQSWPDDRERKSFQHTLSAHERKGWKLYSDILKGDRITEAVNELVILIQDLEKLAQSSQDIVAIPEKSEKGFIGHPAESRLKIVTGLLYNFAGYGCVILGYDNRAQDYYVAAIQIFRETKHPSEPTVTNNLSRALSDQGSPYARLICLDGLARRKELSGLDVAYAFSLNTLALIDNDSFRPDLAWREAALALAYFRRAENFRGEALALLQLAEALRRLARQEVTAATLTDKPETVYERALNAVRRAESLFYDKVPEKLRQIEAYIEMGCIHRDLVRFYSNIPSERDRNFRDALACFREAANLASEKQFRRYQIDTQINVAWTHYYNNDWDKSENEALKAESLFPEDSKIQGKNIPDAKRDYVFVFYQWGKLSALRGRIAIERFHKITETIKSQNPNLSPFERSHLVEKDKHAMAALQASAYSFTLAAGYNWLFSSRSPIVRIVEEPLYKYLKKFNYYELRLFSNQYKNAVTALSLKDKVFIDDLITKCFGSITEG